MIFSELMKIIAFDPFDFDFIKEFAAELSKIPEGQETKYNFQILGYETASIVLNLGLLLYILAL